MALIADQAGRCAVSTIQWRTAAVVHDNRQAGHGVDTRDPLVADALAGARQEFGTPPRQAVALMTAEIRAIVSRIPTNLTGLRDRAILLLRCGGARSSG